MLLSIQQLYGDKLGASDGEIGDVKDLYFDDQHWAVRYLVADTGTWLPGRQVLISPRAFGALYQPGKLLLVKLSRQQIEDCPSIEAHKPVSRQYEETYHHYYGWPYYWQGGGVWGMSGYPVVELPGRPFPADPEPARVPHPQGGDAHLRSAQAVNGYQIKASDGMIGYICDFLMDDQSWVIKKLVIKIGNRFSGKAVQISTGKVDRISYEESTVFVNLSQAAIEQSTQHPLASAGLAA